MISNNNEHTREHGSAGEPFTAPVRLSTESIVTGHLGAVMCRISNKFRMGYKLAPGLYMCGNPDKDSPVVVTANYKLTVDTLCTALKGRNIWLLVIDTKGINVWCAAGKGTFCTQEIVKQISRCNLGALVSHRKLILPQLGASGVAAHKLHKESGYTAMLGPVRASDLPRYLDNGCKADPAMRRVRFSMIDRAKLLPMEAFPALKQMLFFLLLAAVLFGITHTGILFDRAINGTAPFLYAGLLSILTGSILTPLLLPFIPFRAFYLKGLLTGLIGAVVFLFAVPSCRDNPLLATLLLIALPAFSSYQAFLFTGSTTYTSPSGVKKELKSAWPYYLVSAGASIPLFLIILVRHWGIL